MNDQRAIEILRKFCNPEFYSHSNEVSVALHTKFSKDELTDLKQFLEDRLTAKKTSYCDMADSYLDSFEEDEAHAKSLLSFVHDSIAAAILLKP